MNAIIERKDESEITGVGAAIAAGLYIKYWENLDEVVDKIKVSK
jgi:glycerol kinase